MVLTFESADEFLIFHYSRAVLSCATVYYAVQGGSNFSFVDEILKCDHSNESYCPILSCVAVYFAAQGGSKFFILWMRSQSATIQMKVTEQYFPVVLFIMLYKVVLTFHFVDEIINCDLFK